MTSKWIKRGLIGLVLFVVVGGLLFGKDLSSYVRSTARMTQDKVKDAVPIEFELSRAQDLLGWKTAEHSGKTAVFLYLRQQAIQPAGSSG